MVRKGRLDGDHAAASGGTATAPPSTPASPRSAALFRRTIESLHDGVVVADLSQRVLLRNPAAERLLGPGLTDVPTSQWTAAYGCFLPDKTTPCPPEDLPMARALLGEVVTDFEIFVRSQHVPDGRWLTMGGTPLRGDSGEIEGSVVVFRDVTARRRQIEEIQFLSNAVEQTADAVLITDRNGLIEYVNPAFQTITGYSRAEALGQTPAILKSGVHTDDFYRGLWRTVLDGGIFRGTITNRRKDGELYLSEQTITPMRSPNRGIAQIVSVAKDVTKLRKTAAHESTLLLARSVQQRLYPAAAPRMAGLDIAGAAYVADETGGDYFDFVPLPGDCLAIVIGDVSGHGVDSTLLTDETRAVLRSTAHTTSDPSEMLTIVNRVLAADMEENRFVTLLVARLHGPTRTFTYASAGHTTGYVLAGSNHLRHELPATGLPLGPFPDAVFELSPEILLDPGDRLLLLTDGVTESEAPDGSTFGIDRALDVIHASRDGRSTEIVAALYRAARALQEGAPQRDDMTVVVCAAEEAP